MGLPARAALAMTCFPFRRALECLDAPGPGRTENAGPPAAPAPALEDPALATFAAGGGREGPLEPAEVPRETAARAAADRSTCAAKRIPSLSSRAASLGAMPGPAVSCGGEGATRRRCAGARPPPTGVAGRFDRAIVKYVGGEAGQKEGAQAGLTGRRGGVSESQETTKTSGAGKRSVLVAQAAKAAYEYSSDGLGVLQPPPRRHGNTGRADGTGAATAPCPETPENTGKCHRQAHARRSQAGHAHKRTRHSQLPALGETVERRHSYARVKRWTPRPQGTRTT